MSTPVRLAGFAAAVAAIFGLALVIGRLVGPVGDEVASPHESTHADEMAGEHGSEHGDHDDETDTQSATPGGLTVSEDGYSLTLADDRAPAGNNRMVSFTIAGPDGSPVIDYEVAHDKELHLIAVRRDFTGFQHVHPTLDRATGLWSVDLDLAPGTWRVFADFKVAGAEPLTLGADLAVAGRYQPAAAAVEARTATVGDYEVTLEGDLTAGTDAELTLTVSKDGEPVSDLEPYLGAYGHLVALRDGDLAYLHVHPDGSPGDGSTQPGPDVTFYAAVPSDGVYHHYLDFRHDRVVRTAAFTVNAGGAASTPSGAPSEATAPTDHGEHSGH